MRVLTVLLRKLRTLFLARVPSIATTVQCQTYSFLLERRFLKAYQSRLSTINNDIDPKVLIHFLTLGRVEFYDALPVYTHLLNTFLGSSWSHTYIADRNDDRCPSALVSRRPFRWLLLDILDRYVNSKYVTLLHLDYFLLAPVNHDLLQKACMTMDLDDQIDFIQLACNCGEIFSKAYNEDFFYLDDSSELFFNMQVRIWRRASLFKLFVHTSYNDISCEKLYSISSRRLGLRGLIHNLPSPPKETCINNPIYPYMATALNARKWRQKYAPILIPLLHSFSIDPNVRGWIE